MTSLRGQRNSQNREAFNSIGDGKSIRYETAGALGDGERIFITAKIDDQSLLKKMI